MTHTTDIANAKAYLDANSYTATVEVISPPRSLEDIMMDSVNLINSLIADGLTDQDSLDTIKRNADFLEIQQERAKNE